MKGRLTWNLHRASAACALTDASLSWLANINLDCNVANTSSLFSSMTHDLGMVAKDDTPKQDRQLTLVRLGELCIQPVTGILCI